MEKRKFKMSLCLLLTIIFLTACSFPSSTPTLEPQTTEIPQTGATVTPATPEGSNTPVTGEGLCANAYYPVRAGATWSYKSTGTPTGEYSFTDTITAVRNDGFTLSTQISNLTRTQEWSCTLQGLVALQFGGAPAAMLNAQNIQLTLDANNISGVTFPSQMKVGDKWQQNTDVAGKVTVANEEGTATGNTQMNFTALGNESVTVPAGVFDTIKIQVDTTLNASVSYNGLSLPVKFTGTYTYWFAQGVGWVKASGQGSATGISFNETTELQTYNIP